MNYVIGDAHGQIDKIVHLLRGVDLVDSDLRWCGGTAHLWFMGDFCDRGPDGIAVIDLVMRLQQEAHTAGGHVGALLGNHDVLILAVRRYGDYPIGVPGQTFRFNWEVNGGRESDLIRLTSAHVIWMMNLPALVRVGDRLLAHADSTFYLHYGHSLEEINNRFRAIMYGDDPSAMDAMLGAGGRLEFTEHKPGGARRAAQFLNVFGASQLIHGHTPISLARGVAPQSVTCAWTYADGLCINVDDGMYGGGPGFVYQTD